jgi:hypothetical protein
MKARVIENGYVGVIVSSTKNGWHTLDNGLKYRTSALKIMKESLVKKEEENDAVVKKEKEENDAVVREELLEEKINEIADNITTTKISQDLLIEIVKFLLAFNNTDKLIINIIGDGELLTNSLQYSDLEYEPFVKGIPGFLHGRAAEYICAEIIEGMEVNRINSNRKKLTKKDLVAAFNNDKELLQMLKNINHKL